MSGDITSWGGTAVTGRDISQDLAKLDTTLTTLQTLIRWGRNVTPKWTIGAETTAPGAGTTLVSKTVSTGNTGYIYGFMITAQEANDFKINWTSGATSYSKRIVFGGKGTIHFVDVAALNEGVGADGGSSITITNVSAGGSGIIYQAALFVAEA
jgi:hypothetical protein